jgi:hypothetical protein
MLVFIDESGDAGFKLTKGSAKTFVAALVAFRDPASATAACAVLDELSGRLKLKSEFKFHKSRPEIRDAFFVALKPCEFVVRAIVVKKEKIYSQHLRSHKETFYASFVKSMLKFDSGRLNGAKVVIDGSGDREYRQQLAKYLRQHCAWGAIKEVAAPEYPSAADLTGAPGVDRSPPGARRSPADAPAAGISRCSRDRVEGRLGATPTHYALTCG